MQNSRELLNETEAKINLSLQHICLIWKIVFTFMSYKMTKWYGLKNITKASEKEIKREREKERNKNLEKERDKMDL